MNNAFDTFIDDLERKLAASKNMPKFGTVASPKVMGTVTIPVADYNELVSAGTRLEMLQDAFASLQSFEFNRLAGVILGVETEDDVNPEGNAES